MRMACSLHGKEYLVDCADCNTAEKHDAALARAFASGQHAERQRTVRLMGEVRQGCEVGGNTVLDRLVMAIASQGLPDVREALRRDDPISEILQLPRFGVGYKNDMQGRTYVALTDVLSILEKAKLPAVTPEQIVYSTAQRDPGFRKHLIEQLTAMGDGVVRRCK